MEGYQKEVPLRKGRTMKVFFKVASYVGTGLLGFCLGAYFEKEYCKNNGIETESDE